MANDLLRVRICIACNGQFSDEPCEPSECDILRIVENLDPETLRPKGRKERSAISKTGLMCTNCFSDVDLDAVFCKYCGAKMEG